MPVPPSPLRVSAFDRAPQPVRRAIERSFPTADVLSCARQRPHSDAFYRIVLADSVQRWQVDVTPDGHLIQQRLLSY